jgi:hypothetical protein
VTAVIWDSFSAVQLATQAQAATGSGSGQQELPIMLPIPFVCVFAAPLLYLALTWRRALSSVWHLRVQAVLRYVDAFGLSFILPQGASPVMRRTTCGGGVTLLAYGTVVGLAASLLANYRLNNDVSALPLLAPVADDYAAIPVASSAGAHWSGITSGIRVHVHAMGPSCGSVSWRQPATLGSPQFDYESHFNATTAHAVHAFSCRHCAVSAISALDVTFHRSCQTLLVHAFAVNTAGLVTSGSFNISSLCPTALDTCAPVTVAAVAMFMTLDVLDDTSSGQRRRGYTLSPAVAVNPQQAAEDAISLRVFLPLEPFYVARQVKPQQTLSQLLSSIVGLAGLMGAFGTAYAQLRVNLAPCAQRCRKPLPATPPADAPAAVEDLVFAAAGVSTTKNPLAAGHIWRHGLPSTSAMHVSMRLRAHDATENVAAVDGAERAGGRAVAAAARPTAL